MESHGRLGFIRSGFNSRVGSYSCHVAVDGYLLRLRSEDGGGLNSCRCHLVDWLTERTILNLACANYTNATIEAVGDGAMPEFTNIIVETHGRVGLIRLNRPQALNALCDALMDELGS